MTTLKDLFVTYKALPKLKQEKLEIIPEFNRWNYLLDLITTVSKPKEETKEEEKEEIKEEVKLEEPKEKVFEIPVYTRTTNNYSINLDSISARNINAKLAFNHLINKGLSKAAAAGIVGNLYHENLGNPSLTIDDSRGTKAFGIASFNSSGDLPNFLKWAKDKNLDENKIETLLDYLADYVLSVKNKNLTEALLNPDITPEQASYAFGRYYEIFAGRDGRGYLNPDDDEHVRRRETATTIFNKYKS